MWKKFQIPDDYLKSRSDDPGFKRWAQLVNTTSSKAELKKHSVFLRGLASHAGVVANFGRAGSAHGPEHFRKAFYRMTATVDVELVDGGDYSNGSNVAEAHKWVRENSPTENYPLLVSVGGGHDWAAVDFDIPEMQVLHIDTHLDVRPYEQGRIHSGMPFRYLVEKGVKIWNFGAQREYSSPEHWEYGMSNFKGLCSLDDLEREFPKSLDRAFTDINPLKPLGLSIDLDAFPQAVSPGVSAPNPRGISVDHMVQIIDAVAKNLTHVGFYELNPTYDRDDQSSRLAAFLLSRILLKKFT